MAEQMTKQALEAQFRDERAKLESVLSRMSAEQMQTAGVVGGWSVKDVLAHIAVWSARTITLMFQAERGQAPSIGVPEDAAADWANVNAKAYEEQKGRTLEQVLADFRGTHAQLLKRVAAWKDERKFFDKRAYPSLRGNSLFDYAYGNGPEHDIEHRQQIEAWLAAQTKV